MLATGKRKRLSPKTRPPQVEQLEDRRVFNVSWQTQMPPATIQFTEVEVIVVVRLVPAPAPSEVTPAGDGQGLGRFVSDAAQDDVHGLDLSALIRQLQARRFGDDDGEGEQGDGGSTGSGGTGSAGGSTPGSPGNPGVPVTPGGTGSGATPGTGGKVGGTGQGTGSTPPDTTSPQGGSPTPTGSSGGMGQGGTATPMSPLTVQASSAKGQGVGSGATATPVASGQAISSPSVSATSAALAVEAATAGEVIAARPAALRHELVARAELHPAATTVLNSPSSYGYNTVRIDYLPGGTEQPAFLPRAQGSGSDGDPTQPADKNASPPAAPAPAKATKPAQAESGAAAKSDTGAEPQEAGLLTKVPMVAVPPLGLQQALRRLKDLLADLTTSRALLHALPLTGAALVLGGAAFGLVRWQRKKRLTKRDLPDAVPDEEDGETWLPGSGSLPPVDPA